MAKSKEKEFEAEVPVADDEDEATLAAIDEGLHDVESGRTVPIEKVRELLPKWISDSSSPKKR
jgi:predicted transcriptional regulator